LWLHSLKVAQLLRSAACLHTNQSRSYLNHLVTSRDVRCLVTLSQQIVGACFKKRGTIVGTRYENNGSQKAICPQEIIYSHPQSGDTARQSRETAITDFKKLLR